MTIAAQPDSAPDWSKVTATIRCPLCEYELRGLTEPRCPECGFRFAWSEVLDADRSPHPYLFEHHPRRNVWSYFKTKFGGFTPWNFWRTLKPSMPSAPRRLVLYWIFNLPLILVVLLGGFARYWSSTAPAMLRMRSQIQGALTANPNNPTAKRLGQQYGSVPKAIDVIAPDPYSFAGMSRLARGYAQDFWSSTTSKYAPIAIVLLLWPWVTFLTLMIFQISMARARIRPIHVFRCVIYSCDITLIAILLSIPLMPSRSFGLGMVRYNPTRGMLMFLIPCLVLSALTLLKLGFAYRLYLRFPQPWATAFISQFVAALAIISIASAVLIW